MSLRVRSVAVAIAVVLGATACGSSEASPGEGSSGAGKTRSFKADNGTVKIPAKPKRIVATGYAVSPLLEADAPMAGISSWKRALELMSPEVRGRYDKTKKVAGELATETNYEAVGKAKPDLIIIGVPKAVLGDVDVKRLESIAPVVAIGPATPPYWRTLEGRVLDAAGRQGSYTKHKKAYTTKAVALKKKYAPVLKSLKFGHVGGYGQTEKGTFFREYAGSWGTNIADDIGVQYPGEPAKKRDDGPNVSEYPAIEQLPKSLGDVDAITYSVNPDGTVPPGVKYVLDSPLWKNLKAIKNKQAYPVRNTEASTYTQAQVTLGSLDKALKPLLEKK